jgi:hypothetical protein
MLVSDQTAGPVGYAQVSETGVFVLAGVRVRKCASNTKSP